MATKKKVLPSTKNKKAASKKEAASKASTERVAAKVAPKKKLKTVAPAKKAVKKAAPKKAAIIKKAAVKPKAVAKKPAPKKAAVKKAVPTKTVVKPVPVKKAAVKPATVVKPSVKEAEHKNGKTLVQKAESKKLKVEVPTEIKIPKTTVKTSIPYHPGYKSLEERIEETKNTAPMVRYSDSELQEFKELILKKLEAAKKELNYLQGLITRKDELGGDESDNRYMTMEDGSMSMEREQLSQMASRQITYIDHLEKALIRIENKTYGICRVTGKLIDKARLRAVPHATLSLEAKLGLAKSSTEQ
jgi:RNA polymerase-binding transcription factor DksA